MCPKLAHLRRNGLRCFTMEKLSYTTIIPKFEEYALAIYPKVMN